MKRIYTSFHNSAYNTVFHSFNLRLKPSTSRPTHFREIFRKFSHHANTDKGGIVKQSSNDVEGYRSQKVLFQPNVRVFLQYSVKFVESALTHLVTTSGPFGTFSRISKTCGYVSIIERLLLLFVPFGQI